MNTRKTAPLVAIVSLAALLSGVTGAAHARVMVDVAPTAADAQGARLSQYAAAYAAASRDVSVERTEAIRSAKQAEARAAARLSAGEAQGVRLQKYAEAQAEATEGAGGTVDDYLSPLRGDH